MLVLNVAPASLTLTSNVDISGKSAVSDVVADGTHVVVASENSKLTVLDLPTLQKSAELSVDRLAAKVSAP